MECLWSEGVVCKESIFQSIGYIWISMGIVMVILEFLIPGIFISFLGISAILTGLILFFVDMKFLNQIYLWAALSTILIFFGGKFMEKIFPSDKVVSDKIEDSYVGKIVKVTKKVTPTQAGRVLFQGTEWNAKSIG
jgi:membrane protein implicated in regulation of membrane protease activity